MTRAHVKEQSRVSRGTRKYLLVRSRPGLTVGYVGASHIPDFKKDTHAEMLMAGGRAENGKGAEIVISDMTDLPKIIDLFAGEKTAGKSAPFEFPSVSPRFRFRAKSRFRRS